MLIISCVIPTSLSSMTLRNLLACIKSLKLSAKNKVQLQIIVVSENQKIKELQSPNLIYAKIGSGFAGMNNTAVSYALTTFNSDFFLLINDDAKVSKDFFSNFLDVLKTRIPDIVVPLVSTVDGKKIDSYGVEYFTSGYAKNSIKSSVKTSLFSASCVIVRASFIKKIISTFGYLFDELLYFYLEDVELAIRSFILGAKIVKVEQMSAYHWGSKSSGKKSYFTMYQTYRNILWVIIITWPIKTIFRNLPNIILVQAWTFFYSLQAFGPKMHWEILLDTIKNRKNLIRHRKIVKKNNLLNHMEFSKLFSHYSFRTYHDIKIPSF